MSTLRTNALEGVDAKNSITIVAGAGNITTTNVQEGLAKCWVSFDGTGTPATNDSFNLSSITDNSTGNYDANFTNAMNNTNFAPVSTCRSEVSRSLNVTSTSKCTVQTEDDSFNVEDASAIFLAVFGDLA